MAWRHGFWPWPRYNSAPARLDSFCFWLNRAPLARGLPHPSWERSSLVDGRRARDGRAAKTNKSGGSTFLYRPWEHPLRRTFKRILVDFMEKNGTMNDILFQQACAIVELAFTVGYRITSRSRIWRAAKTTSRTSSRSCTVLRPPPWAGSARLHWIRGGPEAELTGLLHMPSHGWTTVKSNTLVAPRALPNGVHS